MKVSSTTSQRFWQERWMIPCNKPLKASYRHILGMQILLKCSVFVTCFRPMNSFQKIFKAIIFLEYRHLCWPDIDRISFLKKMNVFTSQNTKFCNQWNGNDILWWCLSLNVVCSVFCLEVRLTRGSSMDVKGYSLVPKETHDIKNNIQFSKLLRR